MTKVRKVKRKKRFRTNVNRKRLRNKMRRLPTIECAQLKEAWAKGKSIRNNMEEMGLAYDPNKVLLIPNKKRELLESVDEMKMDDDSACENNQEERIPSKIHVAEELEADAKAPRKRMFRLPKSHVEFITYMLDKYNEDYKAMVKDKKNIYQMTWRQIRAKINRFKSIPEQYEEYLKNKMET